MNEPQRASPAFATSGGFPPIPVIRIAAILRYKVPFQIHRVSQLIFAHLATGLRELSDRAEEVILCDVGRMAPLSQISAIPNNRSLTPHSPNIA